MVVVESGVVKSGKEEEHDINDKYKNIREREKINK